MAKGTALKLKYGSELSAVIACVRQKFADKRKTAAGWHGTAIVNVEAGDGKTELPATFIVKGIKDGFQVYGLLAEQVDTVKTTAGKLVLAK